VKESNGFLSESYAFIPIAIAATPAVFVCGGVFLNRVVCRRGGEELAFSSLGLATFLYFGWLFAFLAVKSDFYANFNWGVGFIPFWVVFGGVFIGFVIGALVLLCGSSNSEKEIFMMFAAFFVPGFFGIVAWFVLLTINLEAQNLDEPLIPWILVDTPVFVMELSAAAGVGFLMERVRNN